MYMSSRFQDYHQILEHHRICIILFIIECDMSRHKSCVITVQSILFTHSCTYLLVHTTIHQLSQITVTSKQSLSCHGCYYHIKVNVTAVTSHQLLLSFFDHCCSISQVIQGLCLYAKMSRSLLSSCQDFKDLI